MSSATWTPAALSSERRRLAGPAWRVVEAQHRISTLKLVDTLAEQAQLEVILERAKPPVPHDCRHLHYLLCTPFRYGAPYPHGSRFRRAGFTPGVFYGSTAISTAIVETAFHRLLFFADAPEAAWPDNPGEFTAFSVRYRTGGGLDLTAPPFDDATASFTHPTHYAPCQDLADAARSADIDALRYRSARERGGINIAILACRAFARPEPLERQTWRIHLGESGVRAICAHPEARLEITSQDLAADPRIARMRWRR